MEQLPPTAQHKLYGLDHLRALAILMVMAFHYQRPVFAHPKWMERVAEFGWTGVDLFFVLSGFLIASQLFAQLKKNNGFSIKTFFVKRFFRIIPAYLVVLAIYFCFPFFREKEALAPLWKFLTFTQNFGLDQRTYTTFSHAWSLCVEEHFYLLLPVTLLLLQSFNGFKRAGWLLVILFLLGFAVRLYCWHVVLPGINETHPQVNWPKYLYYPTYSRLDGLLAGVSVAAISQYAPKIWSRMTAFGDQLIITGIVVLTAAYILCAVLGVYFTSLFGYPAIAIGYGLLVAGAVSPTSFLYKWQSKTTTLIATLSYALYLSHKGISHMAQELFPKWGIAKNGNLMLVICFIFCLLGAILLHVAVERPFMKWRDKLTRKSPKPEPKRPASPVTAGR